MLFFCHQLFLYLPSAVYQLFHYLHSVVYHHCSYLSCLWCYHHCLFFVHQLFLSLHSVVYIFVYQQFIFLHAVVHHDCLFLDHQLFLSLRSVVYCQFDLCSSAVFFLSILLFISCFVLFICGLSSLLLFWSSGISFYSFCGLLFFLSLHSLVYFNTVCFLISNSV